MKIHPQLICCFLPLVFLSGCKKSSSTQETSASKSASTTNAAPATTTPASTAPASSSGSADAGASAETSAKMAAAEWALKQDEIKRDPSGQWAIQATASSTYNDAQGTAGWSANQATGAPNVDSYGDNAAAWTSKTPDGGIEWLDLKHGRPVHATEVRVRESCGSGAPWSSVCPNSADVGQFVNFRIRALFLVIQLLRCETSHAFLPTRFYSGCTR